MRDKTFDRVMMILGAMIIAGAFLMLCAPSYGGEIQDKLDAAAPGATIPIGDGVYEEGIVIRKPVHLVSANMHGAVIRGAIYIESSNVTVQGFRVIGTPEYRIGAGVNKPFASPRNNIILRDLIIEQVNKGVLMDGDDWLLERVEVRDLRDYGHGDVDYSRPFGNRIHYKDCWFHGSTPEGVGGSMVDGAWVGPHVDAIQSFTQNGDSLNDLLITGCVFEAAIHGVFLEDIWAGGTISNVTIRDTQFINPLNVGGSSQGVTFKGASDGNIVEQCLFDGIKMPIRTSMGGTVATDNNLIQNFGWNAYPGDGETVGDDYVATEPVPIPIPEGHAAVGYGPESIQPGEPEPDPVPEPFPFTINDSNGVAWRPWGTKG